MGFLFGGSWDLVTTLTGLKNPTCNWGKLHKPGQGDYKWTYKPNYEYLLSPMSLQVAASVDSISLVSQRPAVFGQPVSKLWRVRDVPA